VNEIIPTNAKSEGKDMHVHSYTWDCEQDTLAIKPFLKIIKTPLTKR
jgi:hypothetical protein